MNLVAAPRLARSLAMWLPLCAACACAAQAQDKAQGGVQALQRPALMGPQALRGAMLGVARAGQRIVAVGERGIVLVSDDGGAAWRQVPVPVSVTLTAVRFVSAKAGWATGHSGVVLATGDGGETWTRQLDGNAAAALAMASARAMAQRLGSEAPAAQQALSVATRFQADGPDKPFLDLHFSDTQRGMVVGAYGLAFATEDGGKTWASALERLDNPKGLHLNAIAGVGPNLVIAGEQGLVLRSTDGGRQFTRVETPYRGSWFAVRVDAQRQVVLGGLQGKAYFSPDLGASWQPVDFGMPAAITAFAGSGKQLFAANQAGVLYVSTDAGRSFARLPQAAGAELAGLVELGDDRFVAVGLRGLQRLQGRGDKS